jgi:hypothetical protein
MFKMHCIQQIVAFHRFKNLESQGRVKAPTAAVSKKSKSSGKGSKLKSTIQETLNVPTEGATFSSPINCEQSA